MKKILVTGGAGYIGSHTVVELINTGYAPIAWQIPINSLFIRWNDISRSENY